MRARDIMTRHVITVEPETDVREIAKRLVDNRISAVPVVDAGGALVGIVSEGDLMRRPESEMESHPSWWLSLLLLPEEQARKYVKTHGRHARDVMTRRVITVDEDASLEAIADTLEKHRIKRVPVAREGKVMGIVSRADLLHGLVARQSDAGSSIDDRAIKKAIERALADAGVMGRCLNIVVSGGIVHLWGAVITPDEKEAVRVAAENASGVKGVRDHLHALPPDERAFYWAV
jgi:CBS domain-containing protein